LIALAAMLVLGVSWVLLSGLSTATGRSAERVHNARLLAEAKAALVGWVAANALDSTENNPGRLPCPQAWGDLGTTNEGRAAASCSATAAGLLPWRTLGLQKPLDASGQQLWYVISPGWHLPSSTATLTINSDTAAQLTLDGKPAIALIIAPGAALNIAPNASQSATGCVARSQVQTLTLPTAGLNPADFLDCQNGSAADNVFTASVVDNATNPVFNDQVLALTAADLLPALEAAIAKRIEDQIVPVLKSVYTGANWRPIAGGPMFPFAASFSNPGSASFQGAAGTYRGMLPFNYSSGCSPATDPRCTTTLVAWVTPSLTRTGGTGTLYDTPTCYGDAAGAVCEGYYQNGSVAVRFDDRLEGIAKALRSYDPTAYAPTIWTYNYNTSTYSTPSASVARALNSDGSYRYQTTANFPSVGGGGWGYYWVIVGRPTVSDHALLSANDATTGWFVRNQWYRLLYYAISPLHAAGVDALCTDGASPTCLQVAGVSPANKQRAILLLAGRSLTGSARPNGNLNDYLDSDENRDNDSAFEKLSVNSSANDRVVVIDANP
jgi:hypothetical protein